MRHCDASSLCFNLWGNFLKFENYPYPVPYANPLPNFLVLWIATRLGCLRIFKFGLLTRGLLTQNWNSVNNPTRVALERQPVV